MLKTCGYVYSGRLIHFTNNLLFECNDRPTNRKSGDRFSKKSQLFRESLRVLEVAMAYAVARVAGPPGGGVGITNY